MGTLRLALWGRWGSKCHEHFDFGNGTFADMMNSMTGTPAQAATTPPAAGPPAGAQPANRK